ncbi:hypothetical protein Taro_006570 [Colocasia esculenta]|uniref:Methyltransferase n=1 Tax=Colocasia esculenta TaxID=4460 RepID=A0A843U150_COLES|nr:hypothetical protein [Colocasia esculenta]
MPFCIQDAMQTESLASDVTGHERSQSWHYASPSLMSQQNATAEHRRPTASPSPRNCSSPPSMYSSPSSSRLRPDDSSHSTGGRFHTSGWGGSRCRQGKEGRWHRAARVVRTADGPACVRDHWSNRWWAGEVHCKLQVIGLQRSAGPPLRSPSPKDPLPLHMHFTPAHSLLPLPSGHGVFVVSSSWVTAGGGTLAFLRLFPVPQNVYDSSRAAARRREPEEGESYSPFLRGFSNLYIMGSKLHSSNRKTRSSMSIVIVVGLCCFFYVLGAWQKSGFGKGDSIAWKITKETECTVLPNLNFETHHTTGAGIAGNSESKAKVFKPCDSHYTDYTPCQDQNRAMTFQRENMAYRERHCPPQEEKLHCLIPAPKGYVTPFPWPKSRDYVPFANVPYKSLTVEKAVQNWVQFEGNVFRFPGGGTMFPQGADAYIEELASVIPIADGTVRTALDTGCGVASWGAYMLKRNVLTMSFAPRDSHEAQVQFALERGVPAVIGVLGTIRLPYPSRAFDMAQCSRCLIPWTSNDGMYMMEVDRVLRPGGYWVLSGPPINWKTYYTTWNRTKEDLQKEQTRIEELAELFCWEKKYEKGDIAIWRKKINIKSCQKRKDLTSIKMCDVKADDVWSEVKSYEEDNKSWKKHVNTYKKINQLIGSVRYRNIMDMNAGFGSFAAALESPNSWVMNVVPTISKTNTLGIIYERGLIGIYHDWCEAFSTYPRTYDLIHASGVFSLYQNKCDMEDILLEMDRILRPEGAVIFRDSVDVLNDARKLISGMRWNAKLVDHEDGPLVPEKILVAVKRYWVGGGSNHTSL